jgi:cysteinylglycine-S-conjugate dipeptidase
VESRLWTRPALTIIGLDAPRVSEASNTLIPSARAKFSLRIAPGQEPSAAFDLLRDHVLAEVPFGARVEVRLGELGRPWSGEVTGPVYTAAHEALQSAWGRPAVHMGVGGSIPFIAALQEAYPTSTVLVTGVEDPDSRAHGADESVHLDELRRACVAEALLLSRLAAL